MLHPERRYHLREVARLTGLAAPPVGRELNKLADFGVLTREKVGNQLVFQANPKCPVFEELSGIARKTFGLGDVLMRALEPYVEKCHAVFIYGSMASGEASTISDVDVMFLGAVSFEQVIHALSSAEAALGREINPTIFSLEEWHEKLKVKDSFVVNVLARPKIFLIGDEEKLMKISSGFSSL
ncbi:nucleotidyltransferase domain-containing protein [beta proteobacterium MWH-UniP1]